MTKALKTKTTATSDSQWPLSQTVIDNVLGFSVLIQLLNLSCSQSYIPTAVGIGFGPVKRTGFAERIHCSRMFRKS
jgi:hypothetical protein